MYFSKFFAQGSLISCSTLVYLHRQLEAPAEFVVSVSSLWILQLKELLQCVCIDPWPAFSIKSLCCWKKSLYSIYSSRSRFLLYWKKLYWNNCQNSLWLLFYNVFCIWLCCCLLPRQYWCHPYTLIMIQKCVWLLIGWYQAISPLPTSTQEPGYKG